MYWCYILISNVYFIIFRLQYGSSLVAWYSKETQLLIFEYPHDTIHYNRVWTSRTKKDLCVSLKSTKHLFNEGGPTNGTHFIKKGFFIPTPPFSSASFSPEIIWILVRPVSILNDFWFSPQMSKFKSQNYLSWSLLFWILFSVDAYFFPIIGISYLFPPEGDAFRNYMYLSLLPTESA